MQGQYEQASAHTLYMGDNMEDNPKNEISKKKKVKVNFIPVEGDILDAVTKALEPNVSSVLAKHGASLKIGLKEILRNHAKV